MKYFDAVLAYNPAAVWKLDGDYVDSSGLGNTGSLLSGTLVTLLPCSYGSVNSMRIGNGTVVRLPVTTYSQTKGPKPFSIVVNTFPITVTTETGIVTHDGILDGITIDSTKVYFTVKSSTLDYRVSAPIVSGSMQIIGVFDGNSIALYINGELKATLDAPISIYPTFTNSGFFYCGQGTSTFGLDNVVIYDYAIGQTEVENLYVAATDNQSESIAYAAYNAIFVNVSDPILTPHIVKEWSDWTDAVYTNVNVDDTGVTVGATVGGTWTTSLMLADLSTVTLSSAIISWTGSNVTVETSMDNTTWVAATSGSMIPSMTFPYDATSKCLFIRVTFAANGVLTALKVATYTGYSFFASDSNRIVTTRGTIVDADSNFIPGQTDSIGARLFPGAMKIALDVSAAPISISGVEFMFKIPTGAPSFTLFSNGAGTVTVAFTNTGTITVTGATGAVLNGNVITVGVATSIVQNAWMHLAISFTAANTDCYFGTNNTNTQTNIFRLSRPVLYAETMSTAALQETFANIFSRQNVSVSTATLGISQTPVHLTYNNAWTTV